MSCDNCQKEQQMLQDIILKHKGTPGALIPILHEAQNIYGYLPQEVLHEIAKGLGMPEAEVYGVATFYSQFSLEKKGKYTIILTGHKNNPKNITYKKYKQYKKNVEKLAIKNYGDVFLGRNLVNYGLKFVGNPYKVGGMSLTNGIDCVGFVRALYKKFGITLPGNRNKLFRTGKIVPYSKARAGDIVFYGVHPAIYIGNGKIVSARKSGIRVSRINYKKWTYIRRIR